ncbi:hypothetical protein KAR91_26195 [Candidatus Pacearchaeota archaeon]|nr:hypothetical protein [Candidatus Pacearchaeota archaeon]
MTEKTTIEQASEKVLRAAGYKFLPLRGDAETILDPCWLYPDGTEHENPPDLQNSLDDGMKIADILFPGLHIEQFWVFEEDVHCRIADAPAGGGEMVTVGKGVGPTRQDALIRALESCIDSAEVEK